MHRLHIVPPFFKHTDQNLSFLKQLRYQTARDLILMLAGFFMQSSERIQL